MKSTVLPISSEEFARFFRKCVPPTGWSRNIAVANSGGPDSSCLLFLIHRYLLDAGHQSQLVSVTVNHGLQDAADEMARHCEDYAKSLGVRHITAKIPWSQKPFPDRPQSGHAFEGIARNVRYHVLFKSMTTLDAHTLALGHHSDDQIETSLMRLGRGTTEIGAGGMRPLRRFGMGGGKFQGELGWFGAEGMRRWMVRPLLDVTKERILATCEENNIKYVTDTTNFQPDLTLRNGLRKMLATNNFEVSEIAPDLPPDIAQNLSNIQHGMASLRSVDMDPTGGVEHLRAAVKVLSEQLEDIDSLVDSALKRCNVPSPASTFLLTYRGIASIRSDLVQKALILRIMRYVSFHAWGTIRADANRRQSSISRILQNVWTPNPFQARIPPFVAGGGVYWSPVAISNNEMKIPAKNQRHELQPGEIVGWLASRQPPAAKDQIEQPFGSLKTNPLRVDITDRLIPKIATRDENPGQVLEVLWDNRFLLHIDIDKIRLDVIGGIMNPNSQERILVYPHSRWYWPMVLHRNPRLRQDTILHSAIDSESPSPLPLDRDRLITWDGQSGTSINSGWVRAEWVRSLSAL